MRVVLWLKKYEMFGFVVNIYIQNNRDHKKNSSFPVNSNEIHQLGEKNIIYFGNSIYMD